MKSLFVIALMTALGIGSASAQPMIQETGPCQEKDLAQKVACLNKRLGDLEIAFKQLDSKFVTKDEIRPIKTIADEAKTIAETARDAASGAIKNGDSIKLQSHYSALRKCLWQSDYDHTNAVDCSGQILWRLEK